MREILSELEQWHAAGERIALAVVVQAQRPAPRPVGSWLAVTASGKIAGSVSTGCVESAVVQEAQALLAGKAAHTLHFTMTDEGSWEVGLTCGGEIAVHVSLFTDVHARLLTALRQGETVALVTSLEGHGHLLAWEDGRKEGNLDLAAALEGAFPGPQAAHRTTPQGECFVQTFVPPPTLNIVGAVHLAQLLARLATVAGYHVRVIDPHTPFATHERFPTADEVVRAWPQEALIPTFLRPTDAVVALAHDPKFDVPALAAALRSPVGYIGLLGSRHTQAARRDALRELGFGEDELARIHGPVGFKVGASFEAIAVGIIAEIVAVHNGKWPLKTS